MVSVSPDIEHDQLSVMMMIINWITDQFYPQLIFSPLSIICVCEMIEFRWHLFALSKGKVKWC